MTVRILSMLLAILLAFESGCETPAPRTANPAEMGMVAILSMAQPPEIEFKGFPKGKGQGAAAGLGQGFAACLGGAGAGGCSGALCAPVLIVVLGVCTVVGGIGAGVGAATSPSARQVRESEGRLATAVRSDPIQASLRDAVARTAVENGMRIASPSDEIAAPALASGDFRPLAKAGIDEVAVVGITRVGTAGDTKQPLTVYMEARIEVVRTADNAHLVDAAYKYFGESRRLAEWSNDEGAPLLASLQKAYDATGRHLYDSVFLLYPFPGREPAIGGFGLQPVAPRNHGGVVPRGDWMGRLWDWTPVDSLTPTLSWESFPRAVDLRAAPEELGRITDVRYDLVVAREYNLAPGEVVYRREGLPKPAHTLETPLERGTKYFWTVRARFRLDGRERVTSWGATVSSYSERAVSPSRASYRFRTED